MLGIDASFSRFAIVQLDAGVLTPITRAFPGKEYWGTAETLLRLFDIEDWLAGVLTAWQGVQIDAIVMEGYSRNAKYGREESGELSVIVRSALFQHLHRVPCLVAPLLLKKYVTGKARVEKNAMMMHVYKRWGFEAKNDDEADAAGLAMIGRALCDGGAGLIGAQQDVLTKLEHDRSWRLTRQQLEQMYALPASKRGLENKTLS